VACRINAAHDDASHPLTRLINWCPNQSIRGAEIVTLGLALVLLAWTCTSNSANMRDTVTKAMIRVFLTKYCGRSDMAQAFNAVWDARRLRRI
jgi:hypothetical protein